MTNSTLADGNLPSRPGGVRFIVMAALCMAAAIAYLSRNCLGVAAAEKSILVDLNLTELEMGSVMTAFYIGYSVFQIPGGWIGQRWGSRKALAGFALVWSGLTGLMGLAGGLVTLCAAQCGIGSAQAGLFPNAANSISKWFPAARIAFTCGAMASFMSIGAAMATALTGWLLEYISWRWVFVMFALPGLAWAIVFYWWFRNTPAEHTWVSAEELELIRGPHKSDNVSSEQGETTKPQSSGQADPTSFPPWLQMAASPGMWLVCSQQFFRAAGYIFYSTWFPTFLRETRGVSAANSGYLTSLPLLAIVAGCLAGGSLVDWVLVKTGSRRLSRQGVGVFSMLSCAAFIFLAYSAADTQTTMILISAGSFCAAFAGPCAYAATIDLGGNRIPLVFSVMNMSGNIGAALCPMVVPLVVNAAGQNWNFVLLFFAAIYAIAAICWAFLNPNRPVFHKEENAL